jgi:hypothetical protein
MAMELMMTWLLTELKAEIGTSQANLKEMNVDQHGFQPRKNGSQPRKNESLDRSN